MQILNYSKTEPEFHAEFLDGNFVVKLKPEYVCHLYGAPEQLTTNNARLQLFGKANNGLETLPPIRDALELPGKDMVARKHIGVPLPVATTSRKKGAESLTAVWTRLPPPSIPDACVELVACSCPMILLQDKKNKRCSAACGCVVGCCNPAGQ